MIPGSTEAELPSQIMVRPLGRDMVETQQQRRPGSPRNLSVTRKGNQGGRKLWVHHYVAIKENLSVSWKIITSLFISV